MDHDQSSGSFLQRALKRGQGRCHGRADSLRGFRFYQPQLGVRTWNKKVYFQTLLIAKIVELLAHPTVGLAFEYLRCDEALQIVPAVSSCLTIISAAFRVPTVCYNITDIVLHGNCDAGCDPTR